MNDNNRMPVYQQRIRQKLTDALQPVILDIQDDSERHIGHSGHNPQGETHFSLRIVSSVFEGKPALERHRMVYQILADELKERVHALRLDIKTPDESSAG